MRNLINKIYITLTVLYIIFPLSALAETYNQKPINAVIERNDETAVLLWENPKNISFSKTIIFRSVIPIADYFTYRAVEELCDKIYEGPAETYTDTGLAVNLPYYYILFAQDRSGNNSKAIVIEKLPINKKNNNPVKPKENLLKDKPNNTEKETNTLVGASSKIVNQISLSEAGIVYNYNGNIETKPEDESNRLSLFIIVKSPHDLNKQDKKAISYFIHAGTPTTILLGTGERAGVLNSYLSVFEKLPRNTLEWQDVIKIANGRWPDEKNIDSENQASNIHFQAIYERKPDMNNPKDNAAVTVIAYGLRPANRNIESEKNAIKIYRSIFGKSPTEALDWDLVRAIAYSGATR